MQAACSNCGTQHVLKDADVGAHPKVKFRCSRCATTTVVDTRRNPNTTIAVSPLPSFARGNGSGTQSSLILQDPTAVLPQTKSVVLTIVSGPGVGQTATIVHYDPQTATYTLDTLWATWSSALRESGGDPNALINMVGVAFGQHLVDTVGLAWVIASSSVAGKRR